ncbi:MAG: VOC family protein [Bacteroidales bacterium]
MQLRYTILYVEDVAATLAFYVQAFGLQRKMLHESGQYGELATGATTLSFSSRALMESLGKHPGRPDAGHPSFEIAFETDDVAAAYARALAAGAAPVQEPADMPWGQTTAYVRDLDGFLVEICTAVAAQP